jgi:hypothetical protein
MPHLGTVLLTLLTAGLIAVTKPVAARTTLTMSSWVSPQHHLASVVLQGWATEVEKATSGRRRGPTRTGSSATGYWRRTGQ